MVRPVSLLVETAVWQIENYWPKSRDRLSHFVTWNYTSVTITSPPYRQFRILDQINVHKCRRQLLHICILHTVQNSAIANQQYLVSCVLWLWLCCFFLACLWQILEQNWGCHRGEKICQSDPLSVMWHD